MVSDERDEYKCRDCRGTGQVRPLLHYITPTETCGGCEGSGRTIVSSKWVVGDQDEPSRPE